MVIVNEEKGKKEVRFSWFWKWFLNNQVVTALLIILLCLLIIFVFSKVSYLLEPVWRFIAIVSLPVIMAGILYYLLNPLVDLLEKHSIPRLVSIILLFILIVALITWGVVILIPKLRSQTISFIDHWPAYWEILSEKADEWLKSPLLSQFKTQIENTSDDVIGSISKLLQNLPKATFHGVGNVLGAVANVVVALITMPFILFYLLKDGKKLPGYFIQFLPVKIRKPTLDVLSDVNQQLSSYIRGQLTVAFFVAVIFIICFSVIRLPYAITLGILAGFLNLIPYLGSFLAMIPAVLLGLIISPVMLIKVILAFIIEQTIEGRFLSPLVLGSQLDIHPITILFVLLTAGNLFGLVGVVLGIPGYAAIKVFVTHIFQWYKEVSGLYKEDKTETSDVQADKPE